MDWLRRHACLARSTCGAAQSAACALLWCSSIWRVWACVAVACVCDARGRAGRLWGRA